MLKYLLKLEINFYGVVTQEFCHEVRELLLRQYKTIYGSIISTTENVVFM